MDRSLSRLKVGEMNLSCWTSLLSQVEPCNGVGVEMDFSMAGTAKYDEIFFDITSKGTARLNVMDLEILGSPASLTSPAITPQHLPAKPLIGILVHAEPRMFRDG
jgi:hypothetical protein